jgi:hypothetical protein
LIPSGPSARKLATAEGSHGLGGDHLGRAGTFGRGKSVPPLPWQGGALSSSHCACGYLHWGPWSANAGAWAVTRGEILRHNPAARAGSLPTIPAKTGFGGWFGRHNASGAAGSLPPTAGDILRHNPAVQAGSLSTTPPKTGFGGWIGRHGASGAPPANFPRGFNLQGPGSAHFQHALTMMNRGVPTPFMAGNNYLGGGIPSGRKP